MEFNSIFLSGWEYNLLLSDEPGSLDMPSGLPAKALWETGAVFWLFENVHCTKPSLECDIDSMTALGWTSPKIFSDLNEDDILLPLQLTEVEKASLTYRVEAIRNVVKEKDLRDYIEQDKVRALEAIKLSLFGEIINSRKCLPCPSPNCISHWHTHSSPKNQEHDYDYVRKLVTPLNVGFRLLKTPEQLVTKANLEAQVAEERKIQKPLISSVVLGRIPRDEYYSSVAKGNLDVYRPLSERQLANWKQTRPILAALRKSASDTGLWAKLHKDWLPHLREDPTYIKTLAPAFEKGVTKVLKDVEHSQGSGIKEWVYYTQAGLCTIGLHALLSQFLPPEPVGLVDSIALGLMTGPAKEQLDKRRSLPPLTKKAQIAAEIANFLIETTTLRKDTQK